MRIAAAASHMPRGRMAGSGRVIVLYFAGTLLASMREFQNPGEHMNDKNQGEGNRDADRRYRRGVRETVEETTEEERARRAREVPPEELEAARRAEEEGKAKKRPGSAEREI